MSGVEPAGKRRMPAYRYAGGALVPVEGNDEAIKVLLPIEKWTPAIWPERWDRSKRRARARRRGDGSPRGRGRRGAIRVSGGEVRYGTRRTEALWAHQIVDGRGRRALLYLPRGTDVTDENLRDVIRALDGAP